MNKYLSLFLLLFLMSCSDNRIDADEEYDSILSPFSHFIEVSTKEKQELEHKNTADSLVEYIQKNKRRNLSYYYFDENFHQLPSCLSIFQSRLKSGKSFITIDDIYSISVGYTSQTGRIKFDNGVIDKEIWFEFIKHEDELKIVSFGDFIIINGTREKRDLSELLDKRDTN